MISRSVCQHRAFFRGRTTLFRFLPVSSVHHWMLDPWKAPSSRVRRRRIVYTYTHIRAQKSLWRPTSQKAEIIQNRPIGGFFFIQSSAHSRPREMCSRRPFRTYPSRRARRGSRVIDAPRAEKVSETWRANFIDVLISRCVHRPDDESAGANCQILEFGRARQPTQRDMEQIGTAEDIHGLNPEERRNFRHFNAGFSASSTELFLCTRSSSLLNYELTNAPLKTVDRCVEADEGKQISRKITYYVYMYRITRPSRDLRDR